MTVNRYCHARAPTEAAKTADPDPNPNSKEALEVLATVGTPAEGVDKIPRLGVV